MIQSGESCNLRIHRRSWRARPEQFERYRLLSRTRIRAVSFVACRRNAEKNFSPRATAQLAYYAVAREQLT
jgi:hypothetical protein